MFTKLATVVLLAAGAIAQASTPAPAEDNGSCKSLNQPCALDTGYPQTYPKNVFNKASCVAYFICQNSRTNETVDSLIDSISILKFPPKSTTYPALSTNIFKQHSSNGQVWTQQNWIDFYYGEVANRTQVYPPNVEPVVQAWSNVAAWTGFCNTTAIPYQNLNDWFHFQSTAKGAAVTC